VTLKFESTQFVGMITLCFLIITMVLSAQKEAEGFILLLLLVLYFFAGHQTGYDSHLCSSHQCKIIPSTQIELKFPLMMNLWT
jgi:hypothetical protein